MSCIRVAVAGLSVCLLAACAPPIPPGATAEIRLIEERIYAPYLDEDLDTGHAPLEDAAPWSSATRARLAEADRLEQTVLVFKPLTESQEDIISNLRVGEPRPSAAGATVEVRFILGSERVQRHEFIRENGAWRLNNIRAADWELDALLQAALDEGRRSSSFALP